MLRHAFSAQNLFGLMFKIIQDRPDPIPRHYSEDLSKMVQSMLSKDVRYRPTIPHLFQLQFLQPYLRSASVYTPKHRKPEEELD